LGRHGIDDDDVHRTVRWLVSKSEVMVSVTA
jgi:hypothetical protein